jgi:uncharacterized protein YutE (UPF0331/DUF86 family)
VGLEKLLEEIEKSLKIAESITRISIEEFLSDVRNRYTLRLALVEVVEAAARAGIRLLRERFGADSVEGYVQVFRGLVEHGVVSPETGLGMERLARLRNLVIHRYWEVDDARIYREARENGLKVIERFIEEVRRNVRGARGQREV